MSHHFVPVRVFTHWLRAYEGVTVSVQALCVSCRRDQMWPTTGNTQYVRDYLAGDAHPEGTAYAGGAAPFDTAWAEWKTTLSGAELAAANAAEL